MTTAERIGAAQYTDDLSEVSLDEVGDVDIVRASGMEGQKNPLGLSIWRWRVGGDRREVYAVARGLVAAGFDPETVHETLAHLADDVCRPCSGRGRPVLPDTPILSDELCPHCHGEGRKPLKSKKALDVLEHIKRLEREVAAGIMRRLNRQLDL